MFRVIAFLLLFVKAQFHLSLADPLFVNQYDVYQIKCIVLDSTFIRIDQCEMKARLFSIQAQLLQIPVTDAIVNLAFLHYAKGSYQPHLVNVTVDYCKYRSARRKNFLFQWFYKTIKSYSNLNETCEYNSDVYVKDFPVNSFKKIAGFFAGNFKLQVTLTLNKKPRMILEALLKCT